MNFIKKYLKLFIGIGGESESWVDSVLKVNNSNNREVLNLSNYIELICNDHEDHDHEKHEHNHENDEHIWLSIKNIRN